MVNMTISIPDKLHHLIKKHRDVRWSEIARQALWKRARDLEVLDRITSKSTLTIEDAAELDEIIKKGIARKHKLT
ncbi:hypothetical protein H0N98_01025 [Candidatus Micrarchaeota archaeon]|nr:hypothetical protein [Candidatus Micrarchaeota archaeon]